MFDTIAPRYDLVNRMMTFGLDVRWRRQSARALGLPPGARVLDLACGTGDFLRSSRPPACPLRHGSLVGHAAANRTGLPLAQADGPPSADHGLGRRDHLRLRPPELHRARHGCSTSSAGWSAPADGSACSRWPSPTTVLLLVGHRIWFRRVVPVIGGLVSDRAAYRYLPRSTAYLPATRTPLDADRGRVLLGQPSPPVRGPQSAHHRHPVGSAVTVPAEHSDRSPAPP